MRGRLFGKKINTFQLIILGFLSVIAIGTILLMIPAACSGDSGASFSDALFTSTSAVCVTGLVVRDTATFWSPFGQAVILILIQIGGLGVVTVAAFMASASGRKLSLFERSILQDTLSAHQIGGIVEMTSFILKTAVFIEFTGALILLPSFCSEFGTKGIWMAVFHSISAFCNAGFDVMGGSTGQYSSMSSFAGNIPVTMPLCLLIIIGGIGFLTWDDILKHRLHFKRYRMQSKVVLSATTLLILIPTALLFFIEFRAYPLKERFCLSLFHAVTPRTAGFNTADISSMTSAGRALTVVLMMIGGSPGSTAGGMKTTTAAVLFANAISVFRRKKNAKLFGRRIEDSAVKSAATLLMMYLIFALSGSFLISAVENIPVGTALFETSSAIGTVGLSMGITPSLGSVSRLVLISLMFFGRVGGLTLMFAAVNIRGAEVSQYPAEKIAVG